VRTLVSICLLSSVGGWVDNAPDRLKTLVRTISINRIAVIGATALWLFNVGLGTDNVGVLPQTDISAALPATSVLKVTIFAFILVFEVLESLSAAANMLSMERDWVVTAASPDGTPYDLTHLNSAMRRIDLICKLLAPILISIIVSSTNINSGILVVGAMSIASWPIELWCARNVWQRNSQLQVLKSVRYFVPGDTLPRQEPARHSFLSRASKGLRGYFEDLRKYFSSPSLIWIPSVCL
jgi:iron-regulated transporter 1